MGILGKIAGKRDEVPVQQPEVDRECPHTSLVQHWQHPATTWAGKSSPPTSCEACSATFTYDEATALLEHPSVGAIEEN